MNAPLQKSRLGRGLASLIGEPMQGGRPQLPPEGEQRLVSTAEVRPSKLNPRKDFRDEELAELTESIRSKGLVQPIIVRPTPAGGYEIVAGERRWRAAQKARLHEVPVIVRELSDADTFEIALLENIQRQDLNAVEEADAYKRLIGEFGHTQDALARLVHKSRSHIANLLRLLDLPEPVQALLVEGKIDMGHARALIGAPDVEDLAAEVVAKGLSVRDTERLARAAKSEGSVQRSNGGGGGGHGRDADIAALERQLADLIGLGVKITYSARGGTLTVSYSTLDQLDMVCQRLTGEPL